jgi:hypothetical protein
MRSVLALSLAAVLAAGCASAPPAPPDALLASNLFGPPTSRSAPTTCSR